MIKELDTDALGENWELDFEHGGPLVNLRHALPEFGAWLEGSQILARDGRPGICHGTWETLSLLLNNQLSLAVTYRQPPMQRWLECNDDGGLDDFFGPGALSPTTYATSMAKLMAHLCVDRGLRTVHVRTAMAYLLLANFCQLYDDGRFALRVSIRQELSTSFAYVQIEEPDGTVRSRWWFTVI